MKIQTFVTGVALAAFAPSAFAFRFVIGVKLANITPREVIRYVCLDGSTRNECSTGLKIVNGEGLTTLEDDPGYSLADPSFIYPHMTLHFDPEKWVPLYVYTAEYDYPCSYYFTNPSQAIDVYACEKSGPPRVTTSTTAATTATTTTTTTTSTTTTTTTITTTTTTTTTTTSTTTTTTTTPTTTTTRATSTTTIPTCLGNSKGKKKGNGYKDYCCSSHDDCYNRCVKGKCDGPTFPSSTPTLTLPVGCTKGVQGKKNGKGAKGYCCYSDADCKESCINGKCDGKKALTTTLKPTCAPGAKDKKKGNGKKNYCCSTSADCRDTCIEGKYN